jgi:hypothetical protein
MAIIVSECPGEFRSSKLGKVATNKKGQVTSQFTYTSTLPRCEVLSCSLFSFFSFLFFSSALFSYLLFSPQFSFLLYSSLFCFLLLLSPLHSSPLLSTPQHSTPHFSSLLLFSTPYTQITIDTLANLRLRLNVTKDRYRMSQVSHR